METLYGVCQFKANKEYACVKLTMLLDNPTGEVGFPANDIISIMYVVLKRHKTQTLIIN